MRRLMMVAALLLVAGMVYAETSFNAVSVSDTSQYVFFNTPRASVLVCNTSLTDAAYFRLFNSNDSIGAATTSSSVIPVATSATQPSCLSYSKPITSPSFYAAMAFIAASGKTPTVNVYSE